MSTNSRRPLYLSNVKDNDILDYIQPLLEQYSFSASIRELIRDGMRYRTKPKEVYTQTATPQRVVQSDTRTLSSPPQNIKLEEIEVSDEDIEGRLDSF